MLLAIVAFSLSLLGTFLVRSGVLTSVHAFATDPAARRLHPRLPGDRHRRLARCCSPGARRRSAWAAAFALVSRESMLLANNVLLLVAAGAVLLGTLYPLFLDALGLGKISVGPPYFDAVFVPLMAPAMFLMGVGPLARWKRARLPDVVDALRWALGVSLAVGLLLPLAFGAWYGGAWSPMSALGLLLAVWIACSTVVQVRQQLRHARGGLVERVLAQPRS